MCFLQESTVAHDSTETSLEIRFCFMALNADEVVTPRACMRRARDCHCGGLMVVTHTEYEQNLIGVLSARIDCSSRSYRSQPGNLGLFHCSRCKGGPDSSWLHA